MCHPVENTGRAPGSAWSKTACGRKPAGRLSSAPHANRAVWLSAYKATSRREIRQMPIRSGSSIQRASEVPACAHWVPLTTSRDNGPSARPVSSHGPTSPKKDSDVTANHALGSAKSATMAGAEARTTAPNAQVDRGLSDQRGDVSPGPVDAR